MAKLPVAVFGFYCNSDGYVACTTIPKDKLTKAENLNVVFGLPGGKVDPYEVNSIHGDSLLKMDGYDDCIIGICNRAGQSPFIMYSTEKVIQKNMSIILR